MAALKSSFEAFRADLKADIERGAAGRAALERYTDRVDGLVREVFAGAGASEVPVALVALGGYGRRHLCLHSDIDLLLLFGGHIGQAEEKLVRNVLTPLWDLGVTIGHQVRQLDDFHTLEADNPEFLLALIDARWVAGERWLFDRFAEIFHVAATHAHIFTSLLQLVEARHAKFDGTLYQLEPDVKEAPGGLRDLSATRTIALLTDPLLLRRGVADASRFDDAEDFLLRVRSVLHLLGGRNQNLLSHELQERTADCLAYGGAEPRQRVERLMSDYFRHARTVSRSLEWVRKAAPVPVGPNLGLTRDGIRFIDAALAARTPSSWIAVFDAAIAHGTSVSDEALSCIQQHVDRYRTDDFFRDDADRAALMRFLVPRAGLYARLSEMHDCGLLGRMFPEFQGIAWRVVRDFYHKYTVDEHTLLTIRNLERVATSDRPDRFSFRGILADVHAPELLVLALLLHDVGKWRDDEHAVESERMAMDVVARLRLAPTARETVLFLVRHHLRMSQVAFRRDTEDPEVVRHFATFMGSEERLKLLTLMTLVDVEAVGPGVMTTWKSELLWRLYVDTYNHLTQVYGDELIEHEDGVIGALIDDRPADITPTELSHFLEGLPRRYLQLFPDAEIYGHVRLARDVRPDNVRLSLSQGASAWTLSVATHDRAYLFSNICGVLASYGMNILRGHAFTNPNGLVLDVFEFTDEEQFLAINAGASGAMLELLQEVVSGRVDVAARLRGRERGVLRQRTPSRIRTVVHGDNRASSRYTIVDIVTGNALGLLYRISRTISSHGCDVDLVLISTEGETAIDVFHITMNGAKLAEAELQALTDDLQRSLEGSPS